MLVVACTPTAVDRAATTGQPGNPGAATSPTTSAPAGDGSQMTCWVSPIDGEPGPITFEDVTSASGLVEPLTGMYAHVAAFGDVNQDDLPDLVVGTFGDRDAEEYQERGAAGPSPDRLLLTQPGLIPDPAWSTELGRTSGAAFADFDNDGDDDLLLVRHAGRDGDFPVPTRLFENVDGALRARSEPLPPDFRGRTPAVADYDGDGLLDVYVSEDNSGVSGGLLLHNDGGMGFSDVTDGSGLEGNVALSATSGDLDGDLRPDITTSTGVFVNRGGMKFEEVTPDGYGWAPIGDEDDPAGVALGDLDNDGDTDIVVGQHYRATVEFDSEVPVRVFANSGDGSPGFEEVGGLTPLPTLAPHVSIADIDNDGWLDIVTTASAGEGTRPAIYHNRGTGDLGFEVSAGLGSDQYWIGGPVTDFDHDGRLDLFVVEWEPSLPSILFRNTGETGHWLEVSIDAPGDGIGTLVTVSAAGDPIGRQEIGIGGGYSSGHLPVAHFGLGSETTVDVTITLPDGTVTQLPDVNADQHLRWPNGC
jgi:hypothetical protein